LHAPQEATAFAPASRSDRDDAGALSSPWMHWISESLSGQSVDVVHFLCHGYLSLDQGALALAESPLENRDERSARFVGPRQLSAFLTQMGAWGLGLSSPRDNFSVQGLRLLADQIARQRCGAVFLHEMALDEFGTFLLSTYDFLLRREDDGFYAPNAPPLSPAISLSVLPRRLEDAAPKIPAAAQPILDCTHSMEQVLIELDSVQEVPTWIASSQRYLEQSVAQLLEYKTPRSEPASERVASDSEGTVRQATTDALRFVADVLERHSKVALDATLNASSSHTLGDLTMEAISEEDEHGFSQGGVAEA
jgi:hypothetical protein